VETKIPIAAGLFVAWFSIATFGMPGLASAEWYVAGNVGVNFADRLTGISGTGDLTGVEPRSPDFDLKNSISYGAKLGYFPEHSWFGIEGEVFQTTPHIASDHCRGQRPCSVSWTYVPALCRSRRGHGDCPPQ